MTVTVFNGEMGNLRVIDRDGQPWFVVKDVCAVLGLRNATEAVRPLADDEKTLSEIDVTRPAYGRRGMTTWKTKINAVSESGFYKLVMRSEKPIARKFQDWVTREVLPKIRSTGNYGVTDVASRLDRIEAMLERIVMPKPSTVREHRTYPPSVVSVVCGMQIGDVIRFPLDRSAAAYTAMTTARRMGMQFQRDPVGKFFTIKRVA